MTNTVKPPAKTYCSVAHCPEVARTGEDVCSEHDDAKRVGNVRASYITGLHKFRREMKDNADILNKMQGSYDYDFEEDENYRQPLSVETLKTIHIMLSTGGGGDGYKLTYSPDGDLLYGYYYWQDWGTYDQYGMSKEECETVEQLYLCGDPRAFL